jgi:vacuolar-type H+-ATPase subunit I/STV1
MKIENISKEVEGIKNIFLQYVMNNKQVTKEDIDSLRNELNMLKDQLTKQDTSDVTREIQEEIASIKDATTEILEDQAKNKEKIKKFLDEYKNRKNSYL